MDIELLSKGNFRPVETSRPCKASKLFEGDMRREDKRRGNDESLFHQLVQISHWILLSRYTFPHCL